MLEERLSEIETEVVVLRAIMELIDSIVNFEILLIGDSDPTETRFKSITHAKYFNIVLVDLLSSTDKRGFIAPAPYLAALRAICADPRFDHGGSIGGLREATGKFVEWLETTITVDRMWMPTVWTETNLRITRLELIKVGGNICRHNFLRAVGIAEDVKGLLSASGVQISLDQALLVLGDVYEWLHKDLFHYHASTIAEFLNNIRWGIYEYLQPEYRSSLVKEKWPGYRFTYPKGVVSKFGQQCYWDLMNVVRSKPYMRRFVITEYLKKRY